MALLLPDASAVRRLRRRLSRWLHRLSRRVDPSRPRRDGYLVKVVSGKPGESLLDGAVRVDGEAVVEDVGGLDRGEAQFNVWAAYRGTRSPPVTVRRGMVVDVTKTPEGIRLYRENEEGEVVEDRIISVDEAAGLLGRPLAESIAGD